MFKTNITDFLKDMIIPPVCVVCGRISAGYLCRECISHINIINDKNCCSYCGRPISSRENGLCSLCRKEEYNFTAHRSYALYSGIMKKIIKKYKYEKIYTLKSILCGFLSDIYNKCFPKENIDYVDTVPGEHTGILAGEFSIGNRIPFMTNIIKIRKTERQSGMGLVERKVNMPGSFKLRDCLAYYNKSILLIDDVWTTGSTLKEMCRAVRSGGAKNIYLITLARGV